ncbi:hypothetical protein BVG97_16265 [Serratia marcescens]|uniref:hypothetical protein n=1 Tax=Serratia marcescens TaxID=615 RepID=UPI000B5E809C|nr:hypothetical protein [Serratia marcescens]ASL89068.1 hypothetical protein BVG97_16265 [Serratia marcescens]
MDKFSELKAAAAKYSLALNAHRENPTDKGALCAWDTADGEFFALINNNEMEIIIALLAELEAKDKRIANLEFEQGGYGYSVIEDLNEKAKRIAELEAKLATPVRLPGSFYPDGDIECPLVVELDEAVEAIRTAGFTVEGDE